MLNKISNWATKGIFCNDLNSVCAKYFGLHYIWTPNGQIGNFVVVSKKAKFNFFSPMSLLKRLYFRTVQDF